MSRTPVWLRMPAENEALRRESKRRSAQKARQARPAVTAGNSKRAVRLCLRCDRKFRSQGPHNRICPGCADNEPNYFEVEERAGK